MTSDEHVGRRIAALDDTIHQRTRLALLSVLAESDGAEVRFLKRVLGLTDGNLGRHLNVLREAGLIATSTVGGGRTASTWVRLTDEGLAGYREELRTLTDAIKRLDNARMQETRGVDLKRGHPRGVIAPGG
jgi:DNA-binding transcriptional ArsR family regulator